MARTAPANLTKADLTKAEFGRTVFSGADLTGADLSYANISRALFDGARLSGVNLTGAYLLLAHFEGADLSERVAHYLEAAETVASEPVAIEADLSEADGIWQLQLRYGEGGSRQFRARRCETVVDAAAFVVAVAIDPEAGCPSRSPAWPTSRLGGGPRAALVRADG